MKLRDKIAYSLLIYLQRHGYSTQVPKVQCTAAVGCTRSENIEKISPSIPELLTGLYHPNEDDMAQYINDKLEREKVDRYNPYGIVDWNTVMKRGG
jgi:hypothetical protein